MRVCSIIGLATVLFSINVEGEGLQFAGVAVSPGQTITAKVPLSAAEKSFAADATRDVPDQAVAMVALPRNFNPNKSTPILVVFSTSDFKRLNRDDLVDFYRNAALSQGWIVLAGDGEGSPSHDTNGWRAAMTLAALDALHQSFPGSAKWPVAVAGFSGGAKRACLLAPLLVLKGCRICGIYLTGINEDVLSVSYRTSKIGSKFLETPIFISSGVNDSIALPGRAQSVADSIKSAGFRNVRFELFSGGHAVKNAHTIRALQWFRSSPP